MFPANIHGVDLLVALSIGDKGDLLAIRRPRRLPFQRGRTRQASSIGAIEIHDVNIEIPGSC